MFFILEETLCAKETLPTALKKTLCAKKTLPTALKKTLCAKETLPAALKKTLCAKETLPAALKEITMTNAMKLLWFRLNAWGTAFWFNLTQRATRLRAVPVKPAVDFAEIVERIGHGTKYRVDRRAGAMRHPGFVQSKIDGGSQHIGDCEDHAGYWIAVITLSHLADRVMMGSISFVRDGKRTGHSICLFKRDGTWYWCDYEMPVKLDALSDWPASVLSVYGGTLAHAYEFDAPLTEKEQVKLRWHKTITSEK